MPGTATPMHFKTPYDLVRKARRERDRLLRALEEYAHRDEIADHAFNLAVTVLSARDWIIVERSELKRAIHDLYESVGPLGRIADFANVSKHRVQGENRPRYSNPALGPTTVTAGEQYEPIGSGQHPSPIEVRYVVMNWPKITVEGDEIKFDLRAESQTAIDALEAFLAHNEI
jgi:hypothetical protein